MNPRMVLDIALASGASTADRIIAALEAAGLEIIASEVVRPVTLLPEDPVDIVREVISRRKVSANKLAALCGLAASTLNRALNNPKHKFMLSTRTLRKIKEWDNAQ